ncbi:hypothetical protein [Bosea thiooxidans]
MIAVQAAAAGNLVAASTMAALLRCLVQKGALSAHDIREIYETALLLLEQQQGTTPEHADAFVAARAAIEGGLVR